MAGKPKRVAPSSLGLSCAATRFTHVRPVEQPRQPDRRRVEMAGVHFGQIEARCLRRGALAGQVFSAQIKQEARRREAQRSAWCRAAAGHPQAKAFRHDRCLDDRAQAPSAAGSWLPDLTGLRQPVRVFATHVVQPGPCADLPERRQPAGQRVHAGQGVRVLRVRG